MRPLTIVQARMSSTRLPGKAMIRLGDKTILEHVLDRLGECTADLGTVVIATTWNHDDDAISRLAARTGTHCHRGEPDDVLKRFVDTHKQFTGDPIVRITADCPFLDPDLLRQVVQMMRYGTSYVGVEDAPAGYHQEAFTAEALHRAHQHATDAYDREHVVPWIIRTLPCGFIQAGIEGEPTTVDTLQDVERLRGRLAA